MPAEPSWRQKPSLCSSSQSVYISPASNTLNLSLQEVLSGRIFLVKEALQRCDLLKPVRETTFRVFAETVSLRVARDLEGRGLEQLHALVTPPQASTARSILETRLRQIANQMTMAFVEMLSRKNSPLYLCKHFGVRIMMPENAIAAYRAQFEDQKGFMIPRGPHMDSWFNTGVNSLNLWIAISRVRPGNGLLIYPDAYGQQVQRHGDSIDPDAPVGAPINFEMEPGDVLVFASDHLHASESNVTDETRYVLTKRLSLGAPRYSPQGDSWVPYYDTRLLGTALEPLASLRSRASSGYARDCLRTARRVLTRQRLS
ncbi:MAG: phytanoyl-CoA dioxygenase family protein [Egibacteraceae bacterium]